MTIFSGSPSLQAIRDDMDDDAKELLDEYRMLRQLVDERDQAVEDVEQVKRKAADVEDDLWRALRVAREKDDALNQFLAGLRTSDAF